MDCATSLSIRTCLAVAAPALMLSGCISMAPRQSVSDTVERLPEAYAESADSGAYRPARWWTAFEDPTLDRLVERTVDENLDIAAAAARVQRAAAQARLAKSALFPQVNAEANASYSDSSLSGSAFGGLGGGGLSRLEIETYTSRLAASYELDLFGRNQEDLRARRSDAVAARADLGAVRLTAMAQTIATYFEIVDGRRQIELAVRNADVLADRVERTEDRYRRGLVESFELYQVRQQLRDVQASLPLREAALQATEGQLAILLGAYPQDARKALEGPLTPRLVFEPVPAGLPSELLLQRPDVFAAWQRLEAARHSIGARRAERFPMIRLSGGIGGQAGSPQDAVDFGQNWAASLASGIVAPILDGGRISANIAAARATYDERAAGYASAVLNAYREVTSATSDYEEKRQRYRLILAQLADADASLDLQAQRFQSGVGSYIAYLDAMLAVQRVQSSLSTAARDVALSRLGVHRALGGDWSGAENVGQASVNGIAERPSDAGDAK